MKVPFDPKEATDFECEKCNNLYFAPVFVVKKISSLSPTNPTGEEVKIPLQAFQCTECKHVITPFSD